MPSNPKPKADQVENEARKCGGETEERPKPEETKGKQEAKGKA